MQPSVFLVSSGCQLCLSHGNGASLRPADLCGARGLPALHQQVKICSLCHHSCCLLLVHIPFILKDTLEWHKWTVTSCFPGEVPISWQAYRLSLKTVLCCLRLDLVYCVFWLWLVLVSASDPDHCSFSTKKTFQQRFCRSCHMSGGVSAFSQAV